MKHILHDKWMPLLCNINRDEGIGYIQNFMENVYLGRSYQWIFLDFIYFDHRALIRPFFLIQQSYENTSISEI